MAKVAAITATVRSAAPEAADPLDAKSGDAGTGEFGAAGWLMRQSPSWQELESDVPQQHSSGQTMAAKEPQNGPAIAAKAIIASHETLLRRILYCKSKITASAMSKLVQPITWY